MGRASKLWEVVQRKKRVTVDDISPKSAKECAHFGELLIRNYGGIAQAFTKLERNGRIDFETFEQCVRWKCNLGNARRLFSQLPSNNDGHLHREDFMTLQRVYDDKEWRSALMVEAERKTQFHTTRESLLTEVAAHQRKVQSETSRIVTQSDADIKAMFFGVLTKKYGSLVKAFRLGFDPDGKEALTFERFNAHCEVLKVENAEKIWSLLDTEKKGIVTLSAFDPSIEEELVRFKKYIEARYKTMANWMIQIIEDVGTFRMTFDSFRELCANIGYMKNPRPLWAFLDVKASGIITVDTIDPDAAKIVCENSNSTLKLFVEKTRCHGELAEPKLSPTKWRSISPTASPKKEDRRVEERRTIKQSFLDFLSRKYGSVTAAWKKGMNPEESENLNIEEFGLALARIRYELKPEELSKLWLAFGKETSQAKPSLGDENYRRHFFTLDDLYPDAIQDLHLFKDGLIERYGSLANAFQTLDEGRQESITFLQFDSACFEIKYPKNVRILRDYLADKELPKMIPLASIDSNTVDDLRKRNKAFLPVSVSLPSPGPRELPSQSFCVYLTRRYGSTTRAWMKFIDPKGLWKLSHVEFVSAVQATGWPGPVQALWRQLQPWATFPQLDPALWARLQEFHDSAINRFGSFEKAFEPTPMDRKDFSIICRYIHMDSSDLFDVLNIDHTELLECPQWLPTWVGQAKKPPKRRKSSALLPVKGAKTISNFSSAPALRDAWNESHIVMRPDPVLSLLHELVHINTKNKKKFSDRVAHKLEKETLVEWHKRYLKELEEKELREKMRQEEEKKEAEKEAKRAAKAAKEAAKEVKKKIIRSDDL